MRHLVCVVPLLVAGCSAFAVERPRSTVPADDPGCDASWVPPAIDTTIALAGGAASVWALAQDCDGEDCMGVGYVFLVGLPVALVYGVSAYYGYAVTVKCRDAEIAHEQWVAARTPPPPPPPPPPTRRDTRPDMPAHCDALWAPIDRERDARARFEMARKLPAECRS